MNAPMPPRVAEALGVARCEIITAKDVDAAVAACAKVEPRVVLTTSVLRALKVEDAITQLRAPRRTAEHPLLVMMSGDTGRSEGDAAKLGAQDIVAKPFSNDELLAHVKALLTRSRSEATVTPDNPARDARALRRGTGPPSRAPP